MAKVSAEQLAIAALAELVSDSAPKLLHGSKTAQGIFKGASAAEKAAAKVCLDQGWLAPTGEFAGKGKTRKELYRITAAGMHTVLARSDPSDLLRHLQESMQQLGGKAQEIPRTIEEKIKEALAPFVSLPGMLQSLQANLGQALDRIKLPTLEELSQKLNQTPVTHPEPATASHWPDEVVQMAVEQKQRNAFQRLTLPQVFARLQAKHPHLSLGQFHDGLRKLQDDKRIRLGPYTQALATLDEPRNALFLDREVKYYVEPY